MNDPKDEKQSDGIVATEAQEAELVGDGDLDEVEGGWSFLSTSSTSTVKVRVSTQFATNYGGGSPDSIDDLSDDSVIDDTKFLRVRPGRIGPSTFGGG
ncbi:MAG: hypothetical protein AAGK00_07310 [Pseudomonadota bacterium]